VTSNKNVEDWTIHLLFIAGKKQENFSACVICFSKSLCELRVGAP